MAPWAHNIDDQADGAEGGAAPATDPPTPPVKLKVGGEEKEFSFVAPTKQIKMNGDLLKFQRSDAYKNLKAFILGLNEACKGKKLEKDMKVSDRCQAIIGALQKISGWIDEIPPIEQPMRYGNKAFRDWMDKIRAEIPKLVEDLLPQEMKVATKEVAPYLVESWGNKERIDYGTGHEHCFVTFLAALAAIGYFEESDMEGVALRVFWEYLKVARKLQLTYRLEPAGSHGCWSLDDYQFIPFMWGSAQLIGQDEILPKHIHDLRKVEEGADTYYYMHCIKFIHEVKSGQLAENSPMLNDISGCPTWQRVNVGMTKMYFAEVMDKLPVIQHMLFGSIFKSV